MKERQPLTIEQKLVKIQTAIAAVETAPQRIGLQAGPDRFNPAVQTGMEKISAYSRLGNFRAKFAEGSEVTLANLRSRREWLEIAKSQLASGEQVFNEVTKAYSAGYLTDAEFADATTEYRRLSTPPDHPFKRPASIPSWSKGREVKVVTAVLSVETPPSLEAAPPVISSREVDTFTLSNGKVVRGHLARTLSRLFMAVGTENALLKNELMSAVLGDSDMKRRNYLDGLIDKARKALLGEYEVKIDPPQGHVRKGVISRIWLEEVKTSEKEVILQKQITLPITLLDAERSVYGWEDGSELGGLRGKLIERIAEASLVLHQNLTLQELGVAVYGPAFSIKKPLDRTKIDHLLSKTRRWLKTKGWAIVLTNKDESIRGNPGLFKFEKIDQGQEQPKPPEKQPNILTIRERTIEGTDVTLGERELKILKAMLSFPMGQDITSRQLSEKAFNQDPVRSKLRRDIRRLAEKLNLLRPSTIERLGPDARTAYRLNNLVVTFAEPEAQPEVELKNQPVHKTRLEALRLVMEEVSAAEIIKALGLTRQGRAHSTSNAERAIYNAVTKLYKRIRDNVENLTPTERQMFEDILTFIESDANFLNFVSQNKIQMGRNQLLNLVQFARYARDTKIRALPEELSADAGKQPATEAVAIQEEKISEPAIGEQIMSLVAGLHHRAGILEQRDIPVLSQDIIDGLDTIFPNINLGKKSKDDIYLLRLEALEMVQSLVLADLAGKPRQRLKEEIESLLNYFKESAQNDTEHVKELIKHLEDLLTCETETTTEYDRKTRTFVQRLIQPLQPGCLGQRRYRDLDDIQPPRKLGSNGGTIEFQQDVTSSGQPTEEAKALEDQRSTLTRQIKVRKVKGKGLKEVSVIKVIDPAIDFLLDKYSGSTITFAEAATRISKELTLERIKNAQNKKYIPRRTSEILTRGDVVLLLTLLKIGDEQNGEEVKRLAEDITIRLRERKNEYEVN